MEITFTPVDSIAVIYLARGLGAGLPAARNFFASYDRHPAGAEHELVVLVKGWAGAAGLDEVLALAEAHGARVLELPDDGLDIGAYFRAAERLSADRLLFLNSHSRPRHDNWLRLLNQALARPGAGAVACSASWNSVKITAWAELRRVFLYARFHLLLRALLNLPAARAGTRFGSGAAGLLPYVNPHLRTNAFLVQRNLWLDFAAQSRFPKTKKDCYRLEHGSSGFTRFLMARGLRPVVAGADGQVYEMAEWAGSGVFCSPGLPNLLIHDNQSDVYLAVPPDQRRAKEFGCWGRCLTAGPEPGWADAPRNWRAALGRFLIRRLGQVALFNKKGSI